MDGWMRGEEERPDRRERETGNSYISLHVPPRSGGPRSAAARRKWLCNRSWPVHPDGWPVQSSPGLEEPRRMYICVLPCEVGVN